MSFFDVFKNNYSADIVRGIEKKLLKGRREKKITGLLLVVTLILDVLIIAMAKRPETLFNVFNYLKDFGRFVFLLFSEGWQQAIAKYTPDPAALLLYGSLLFLLFLLSRVFQGHLTKLSEEPFQYTFWIKPFKFTKSDLENTKTGILEEKLESVRELLHHDLKEKLSERIGRLSLLNISDFPADVDLSSHIQIEGYLTLREETTGSWVVHVMPHLRLGGNSEPFKLTNPVKRSLNIDQDRIKPEQYNQVVEWVYANVASEIYSLIKLNVQEKIRLFPNRFLKAIALCNEARDFAESNTIDAYELSIELYGEAKRYLKRSLRSIVTSILNLNFTLYRRLYRSSLPWWLTGTRFYHLKAGINNGHALCKIYKADVSPFVGRESDPLFDLPEKLTKSLNYLLLIHNSLTTRRYRIDPDIFFQALLDVYDPPNEHKIDHLKSSLHNAYVNYPKDSWLRYLLLRPSKTAILRHKKIFFDSVVALAYVYSQLGSRYVSLKLMDWAGTMAPSWISKDHVYLLTKASLSTTIPGKIAVYSEALKINDKFEISQFLLARWRELSFRFKNELYWERAKGVIEDYQNTLKINPGNIAALASQGYLYWLTDKLDSATAKFKQGREVRTIIPQTYISEINYGLARIAVEKGQFNSCYDLFQEAVFFQPMVAAYANNYSLKQGQGVFYYDLIGSKMLERYRRFVDKYNDNLEYLKYCFRPHHIVDLKETSQYLYDELKAQKYEEKFFKVGASGHSLGFLLEQKVTGERYQYDKCITAAIINFLNSFYKPENSLESKPNYFAIRQKISQQVPGLVENITINRTNDDGEVFSPIVLKGVKSFVQNDYGNAWLNYFNRFGVPECCDNSIRAYQEAINADPENKAAHYNIAIAYQIKEKYTESYEHLNEARKIDRDWFQPVHDLARKSRIKTLEEEASRRQAVRDYQPESPDRKALSPENYGSRNK